VGGVEIRAERAAAQGEYSRHERDQIKGAGNSGLDLRRRRLDKSLGGCCCAHNACLLLRNPLCRLSDSADVYATFRMIMSSYTGLTSCVCRARLRADTRASQNSIA